MIFRRKGLTADQLRASKPARNPEVTFTTDEEGGIQLEAPLDHSARGKFAGMLARKLKVPASRKFELEPVGAYVWELCDGSQTFETIAKKLRERFKMNRLEAEAALAAFLQMLGRRGLITIAVKKR
jgi:hypothetical protein